ncbi:c2h2 transcription factor [Grosmannia clavigera kw1407]|uniref:C2h2 transcription factor n=1 Tax=Grosmannia clavigera (strain kw1407 / UAMH 11150) TaxID=655863 RepID=F0XRE9_GROCL|nr:c2h2 transcription factor [Grosmannia clavigera kw1407]EFW99829.1 c2h2 transcription factor [Grosmannia clavigera kw1407]
MISPSSSFLMTGTPYGQSSAVSSGVSAGVAGLPTSGPATSQQMSAAVVSAGASPMMPMASPGTYISGLSSEAEEDQATSLAAARSIQGRRRSERLGRANPSPPPTTAGSASSSTTSGNSSGDTFRPQFSTQVDILMRTIQSRAEEAADKKTPGSSYQQSQGQSPMYSSQTMGTSPTGTLGTEDEAVEPVTKPFACTIANCTMTFWQKTHLDIHKRSHTGEKPYVCSYVGCGAHFSQLGNLRTHERRHTGEKPFRCDKCGKYFAQRGNLKAHVKTHLRLQPYECRLDLCKKRFTQLGNMKAHQNKYHATSLAALTNKFAQAAEGDEEAAASITEEDRELFQHFADLYKNSNKGIKGRGKHRRVRPVVPKLPISADIMNSAPTFGNDPASSSRRTRISRGGIRGAGDATQPNMLGMPGPMAHHPAITPTSADGYMVYPSLSSHSPSGASTVPYSSSLGKLVNGPPDNSSITAAGHGGHNGHNNGSAYGHHHGHPPPLPPPLLPSGPYGGQPAMTHSISSSHAHASHQGHHHPAHQHPHGNLHGQPMHGIASIHGHSSQHGHGGPSGPVGPHPGHQHHGHPGHSSTAANGRQPSATGFVSYDNDPVRGNGMYDNGVY